MTKCVNTDCQYFRGHGKCAEVCTNQGIMKIVTNADKIRNMSDKELAEWLTEITDDAQLDARTKCNYQWYEWLQSEANKNEV